MSERSVDEYGRPIYRDSEVPPVDASMCMWMGNITTCHPPTPANSVGGCHPKNGHPSYATCFHGWVRSGAWWLHCSDCHPPDMEHYEKQLATFRASFDWALGED